MRAITAIAPGAIFKFLLSNFFQASGNFGEGQRAEMKVLRTRADGVFQVFRLSGGHHKDYAVRGSSRVFSKALDASPVSMCAFIQDHNFAARSRRSVSDHFSQFANLVDAAVGCGVNFNDVQRIPSRDFFAGVAHTARRGCRATARNSELLPGFWRPSFCPRRGRPKKCKRAPRGHS